jgi:hypothetical protein
MLRFLGPCSAFSPPAATHFWVLLSVIFLESSAPAGDAGKGGTQLKAAFAAFSADGTSYRAENTARQFTDALSAAVMNSKFSQVEWIERADANLLKEELELSKSGFVTVEDRARVGRWAECDLLLAGRFVTLPGKGLTLALEIVQPRRGELLISTNLHLGKTLASGSKAVFEELDRVAEVTRQLLTVACEVANQQRDQVSIALVAICNDVQNQKGRHTPDVASMVSEAFVRGLSTTSELELRGCEHHKCGGVRAVRSGHGIDGSLSPSICHLGRFR